VRKWILVSLMLVAACGATVRGPVFTPPVPAPVPVPVVPPVVEPARRPEVTFPALCASNYAEFTDPDMDVPALAAWYERHGVTCTRAWLIDAWAIGEREPDGTFKRGQYDGRIPVVRLPSGQFDLSRWDESYFASLRGSVDTMNAHGVWPHLTVLELYAWSDRKSGLPFVPDVNLQPYRNNVNGVRWGGPDDPTLFTLPDPWLRAFTCKVVETLAGTSYMLQVGNEFPEKELHWRMIDTFRECGYQGQVSVNRNEDTPGQYWNMDTGGRVDRLELHGFMDIGYLDVEHPREAEAGRPTTFRAMWGLVDPARVIVSSDGGGGNPDRLPELREVACDALRRGASYEHQLAIKRNRFYGDGTLRMSDLSLDSAFLLSLKGCR
jgi:hypothetical protein